MELPQRFTGSTLKEGNSRAFPFGSVTEVEGATLEKPCVLDAIRIAAGFEVIPDARVPKASSGTELDLQVDRIMKDEGLVGAGQHFFLSLPGPGSSESGWMRVSDCGDGRFAGRIHLATGSPEFMAVSEDGGFLCAVSDEGEEYWVIVHRFSC